MGVLEQRIQELDRLEEKYRQERMRIEQAIADTVRSIGQNPAVTPLDKHMFTIRSSELIHAPWTPEFHDWTVQAERLLSVLGKKPVRQWTEYIDELLAKSSKAGWTAVTVDKTQLSRKFLQQVAGKL